MKGLPNLPRPSKATVDKLRRALERAVGASKLLTSVDACSRYSGDESEQDPVVPDAVVLATDAEDVSKTLAIARDLTVPVTPRAAGTGKSGGAIPIAGGVVLCTMGLSAIKEIDRAEQLVVVEPGVVLADLQQAVESEGLFYPPDPNSQDTCAIGGNIAENAGGPRAFKYGVTRDYVLGLEGLTAEGTRLRTGRRTVKGVTGYAITALLVGSEGTLAVTVEATLRLIRKPESVVTILALFDCVNTCAQTVTSMVAGGLVPRCMEMMDNSCLTAIRKEGVGIDERARAMLLIEVDGDEAVCERDMQAVGQHAADAGAIDVVVAQSGSQRTRLWAARRELSNVTRRLARFKVAEDVVVPRGKMAQLVSEVTRISEQTGIKMLSYGHAGDGNMHVTLLWDDPEDAAAVSRALDDLFNTVIRMGGCLTGEHGIGLSKAPYLQLEQSHELIELQRRVKQLFDPRHVLNPGKIFPPCGHGPC